VNGATQQKLNSYSIAKYIKNKKPPIKRGLV
jgi:hypothetical protein